MVADGYRGKAPSALVDWKPTPMDFSAPPEAMELDAAPAEEAPKAPQTIPEMMAEMAQQPDMAKCEFCSLKSSCARSCLNA